MIETRNLEYDEITGLVWLKPHATEDDDSVRLGTPEDFRGCPDEYLEEMDELIEMIRDAARYADSCVQTAFYAYCHGRF